MNMVVDNPIPTNDIPVPQPQTDNIPSLKSLVKTADKILASDTPLEYIEKAGIDLLKIYKNLGWIALNAEIIAKDRDGEPITLGRDNKSQLMATTIILELAKHLKDKNVAVSVGVFNDPAIVNETNRVLALKNRL